MVSEAWPLCLNRDCSNRVSTLGMLRESLEGSPLGHPSAGRGSKEDHSETAVGLVLMPDMESGSSEAGYSHYRDEDLVYCWSDCGLDTAEEDEQPVLRALTTKLPDLRLPDVEDLDVARFCEAKQDHPCHLWCPKGRDEEGKPRGEGDDHPMAEEVAPAGLGGGHRAADIGPFPEAVEKMRVHEDPGLLPMVITGLLRPVAPQSPRRSAPSWASFAEVQRLQENFEKLTELLTNLMGNVEKMNAPVGELQRKVEGSLPQVAKNKDEIKTLGARLRELELFTDTLPEFVHANFNLRITELEQYLVSYAFRQTNVPPPSAPSQKLSSHSSSPPSVPRPGPSGEPPRAHVPPVSRHPVSVRLPDVAPRPSFAPSTWYNAHVDNFDLSHPSSSPTPPSSLEVLVPGPSCSTLTAYSRPDPHYTMYDQHQDGGDPPTYSSPGEKIGRPAGVSGHDRLRGLA